MKEIKKILKDYFIYFPPGYQKTDINKKVDTSSVWKIKVKAMNKHRSQISDFNRILKYQERLPKIEYFVTLQK